MPNERKYFGDADFRCNSDDAPFAVGINEIVNGENIRTATTDAGVTATIESIGSNVLISQPAPSITYLTLKTIEDIENNRIIKFQYNTTGSEHKIVCLFTDTNLEYDVLRSSQVTETGGLNFNKYTPMHSASIVNNLLYWTDNLNEPKRIDINKALKANNPSLPITETPYVLPMVYPTQTIIRRPPYYALSVAKDVDNDFPNNYINDGAFQMTYFYEFVNFEWSKPAAYSTLQGYGPTEPATYNFIACKLLFAEPIDDDVQRIYICVRYGNTGKTFIVHTFDKAIPADLLQIIDHNAGTTQLTFNFYNNEAPQALDDIQANTPFDSVPLLSEAISAARDRMFLGNNLMGYNTPVITSLTGQLVTIGGAGGTWSGEWGMITLFANLIPSGGQNTYMYPFVYAPLAPFPFYYFSAARQNAAWNGGYYTGDLLANVDVSDAALQETLELDFVNALKSIAYPSITSGSVGSPVWLIGYGINYNNFGGFSPTTVVQLTPTTTSGFLKSNGTYNINIDFKDRFRRKSGVVNTLIQLIIPQRTYSQSVFNTLIRWFLSNVNAINEIPDWAYYYQIYITKNLTTRFFLQGQTGVAGGYVVRTLEADGSYTYAYQNTIDIDTQYATAIDVTPLYALGLGYSFTQGDKITVYLSTGTVQTLPIIAQIGNLIFFHLTDVGTFPLVAAYEIYTPYHPADKEPYYEASQVYAVLNPTTLDRAYSVTSDVLLGDVYNLQRTFDSVVFIAEAMSQNDRFWQIWETDTGWVNYITNLGQKRLVNQVRWSETYIPDTQINGLSTFDGRNAKPVPQDCGAIMKLILSSKVQGEQGTVMLAICAGGQTASLYIGETQITDNTGATQFFASTPSVIGTINILKGNRGTLNPESVSEYRGDVFWFDVNNRVWVQYSLNGLDDIVYKFTRFWSEWALKFNSLTAVEIEAFGGRPFVYSVVDPKHKELLISIPKLSNTPPKGYLPDYPEMIYPFDILDFQAKTIVYKLGMAGRLPHYQGSYSWYVENFCTLQNKLYSFKSGNTWLHNQTSSTNNFFGVQYKSRVACVSNMLPNVPKVYDNQSVQSNVCPSLVYMYNTYPYLQSSDVLGDEIRDLEGIWYSTIKRNKLSTGVVNYGLLTGEKMRNTAMFVLFEFTVDEIFLELSFVQFGLAVSRGHLNQLQK